MTFDDRRYSRARINKLDYHLSTDDHDQVHSSDKKRAYFCEQPKDWSDQKAVYKFISSLVPLERVNYLPTLFEETSTADCINVLNKTIGLFWEIDNAIAHKLVALGHAETVFNQLDHFQTFQSDTALLLFQYDQAQLAAKNIEHFDQLNAEIAERFIEFGYAESVIEKQECFTNFILDRKTAQLMIDWRQPWSVVMHLELFQDLDAALALRLIDEHCAEGVIEQRQKFQGLILNQTVADRLLETKQGAVLWKYRKVFRTLQFETKDSLHLVLAGAENFITDYTELWETNILDKAVALQLIASGNARWLGQHLDHFRNLDQEVALQLIESDNVEIVMQHLEYFIGFTFNQVLAHNLLDVGKVHILRKYVNLFVDLDQTLAERLIAIQQGDLVINHPEKFAQFTLNQAIAAQLIKHNQGWLVIEQQKRFDEVLCDKKLALRLLEADQADTLYNNLVFFHGLDHDIALRLIDAGHAEIIRQPEQFGGIVFDQALACRLLKSNQVDLLAANLDQFTELDQKTAISLMENGHVSSVLRRLSRFTDLVLDRRLALHLIDLGHGASIVTHSRQFKELVLDKTIALWLITTKQANAVVFNIAIFKGLDRQIAYKLMEAGYGHEVLSRMIYFPGLAFDNAMASYLLAGHQAYLIVQNMKKFRSLSKKTALGLPPQDISAYDLDRFIGLDHEVAEAFIRDGRAELVLQRSDYFADAVFNQSVALQLCKKKQHALLVKYLEKFSHLDRTIALELIANDQPDVVLQSPGRFQGLELDLPLAVYLLDYTYSSLLASELSRFTKLNAAIAWRLISALKAGVVLQNLEKFDGLSCDKKLALHLISCQEERTLLERLRSFQGLDEEVAYQLLFVTGNRPRPDEIQFFTGVDATWLETMRRITARYDPDARHRKTALSAAYLQGELSPDPMLTSILQDHFIQLTLHAEVETSVEEIAKTILCDDKKLLSDNPDLTLTEANWIPLVMLYIRTTIDDNNLPEVTASVAEQVKHLFEQEATKNFCYEQLYILWDEYIKAGQLTALPTELIILANYVEQCGAGAMSQFEALSTLINQMRETIRTERRFPATQQKIMHGVEHLKNRFETEHYSNDDRAHMYYISVDLLQAAPSLYADFVDLFTTLKPTELKLYLREILPLYHAQLAVIANNNWHDETQEITYEPRDLIEIRHSIRRFSQVARTNFTEACRQAREELIRKINFSFRDRFGIIKVPEQFTTDHIRALSNCALYLGNMAQHNEKHEQVLSWYLALQLNNQWEKFRAGQELDPADYLQTEVADVVKTFLDERKKLSPITADRVGIPADQLPAFQTILQRETAEVMTGDIETIDVKMHNVVSNLDSLIDPDLFPETLDKQRLQLLIKYGSKSVNTVVAKLFQHLSRPGSTLTLSAEETTMHQDIQATLPSDATLTTEYLKREFQDALRPLSIIVNIIAFCREKQVTTAIKELRRTLTPQQEVIQIFNRLGESFTPASGARAIVQDLDYLDQFIVKHDDQITLEEKELLTRYTQNIREQLIQLQSTYDQLLTKFKVLYTGLSAVHNSALQAKLKEVDAIIRDTNQQKVITSTLTNDLTIIIENIRECLSCVRKGGNNDTNLTFGDSNKFFVYSQIESQKKGSVADQIVFLEPITYGEGTQLAFVLDRLYGSRTATILQNHVSTVIKKCLSLKREFPENTVSILVTEAALNTTGVSADQLMQQLQEQYTQKLTYQSITDITVEVAASAAAEHYIEFGGTARTSGPRTLNGLIIQIAT